MSESIKNIIFDLGGVIIPIYPMDFASELIKLGCTDIEGLHERFLEEQVYSRFEKGILSPDEFRNLLREGFRNHINNEQLDHAWNLMIGEIPEKNVRLLEALKENYRTFLLSNTNKIHYDHYQAQFSRSFKYLSLDQLFEKAYYSFKIGLYKPDPAIFEFVLHDSGLNPAETLFIDDSLANTEAAKKCGLQTIHYCNR